MGGAVVAALTASRDPVVFDIVSEHNLLPFLLKTGGGSEEE